jgi:hypothetical protein
MDIAGFLRDRGFRVYEASDANDASGALFCNA